MPDYWLDSDSFIRAKNTAYGFDIAPGFWAFLDQKSQEGIIASSIMVYHELVDEATDDLAEWARQREKSGFFIEPDAHVQASMGRIANYVMNRYQQHEAETFLKGADPWLIAHAMTYGGSVVTFESRAPKRNKAKIPDVADHFNVVSLDLWQLLRKLQASFGLLEPQG